MDSYSLKAIIAREDPNAVTHDMKIVNEARDKYCFEDGWEALQDRCMTQAAKREIHSIEVSKYIYHDYNY